MSYFTGMIHWSSVRASDETEACVAVTDDRCITAVGDNVAVVDVYNDYVTEYHAKCCMCY